MGNTKNIGRALLALAGLLIVQIGSADDLEKVIQTESKRIESAQKSQQKINQTLETVDAKREEYLRTLRKIDDLAIYKKQLALQVAKQEKIIANYDSSIQQAKLVERQLVPLIEKMITNYRKLVEVDLPFLVNERRERALRLEELYAAADISVAEKFRRVLEAYQVEMDYGKTINAYASVIDVDGEKVDTMILQVGRIALLALTTDQRRAAQWNSNVRQWQWLSDKQYLPSIKHGLKLAKKQAPVALLTLPLPAPEVVQ